MKNVDTTARTGSVGATHETSRGNSADPSAPSESALRAPSISLPKGGGAIRGIGEKFAANPVTGTGSMTLPIAASPGRSGFGPRLALSYDSGSGNGPFGFGWSLSLPSVTRKTDKGLPRYLDDEESDVFLLSGAEDLVPELRKDGENWQREEDLRDVGADLSRGLHIPAGRYRVARYRPRIEGLFARIERWTNLETGVVHWRSISRDNVTTLYGKDNNSRIFDPAEPDPEHPRRIFSWLICESYDDKGNAIVYEYKAESSAGVDSSQHHERNRTAAGRSVQRYLKRIRYGNRVSRLVRPDLSQADWLFEVVFDYGEHDPEVPKPDDEGPWLCRHDPFSSYRSGFETRTYRLCRRVLAFHHFPDEDGVGQDCLVRSTDFVYRAQDHTQSLPPLIPPRGQSHTVASFLAAVTQSGYKRRADGYLRKSLPPLELEYSQPVVQEDIREIDAESLENLPRGLDGTDYRWVDLDGEGVSGVLTEQAGEWFYKPNLGGGRFGALEKVAARPSLAALNSGRQQLLDLAADGQLDLVELGGAAPGFFERTHDRRWEPFKPFAALPSVSWDDANLRFVDLNGDGHADVLLSEDEVFTWYPSLAEDGFGPAEHVRQAFDEETGPRLVFAEGTQSVYLADMSGDGLTDLARVRNGEVCYWPNLGYGRFGAKVTMDGAPRFDTPDLFDQQRLRLADVDGSGTVDLIYLGRDSVRLYFNRSGNRWSAPHRLCHFPRVDSLAAVTAVDLLGNGTACLVWSSPLTGDARRPVRYVDLMGGQKPHLLIKTVNNLGAETQVEYAPSTKFYLADKAAGKPWITKLPFPVHVVERVETHDRISRNRFVTRYAYHHGYFDGVEREFRGFGMVEQWDTEEYAALASGGELSAATNVDEASHVPPVLTRTWFHTGVYLDRHRVSDYFAGLRDEDDRGEYYREPAWADDDAEARRRLLPDTVLPPGLAADEEREACRALKGAMLRQEVYALDGTDKAPHPYTVAEQSFTIESVQPRGENRHAVFFTHRRETINYHYERNPEDPRVQHALTLQVDPYGNALKELAIGYGRRTVPLGGSRGEDTASTDPALTAEDKAKQTRLLITYTENTVTNPVPEADHYRTPLPAEKRTYELTGFQPENGAARFSFDEWSRDDFTLLASAAEIPHEQTADDVTGQKRLIEHVRIYYRRDDLSGPLSLGELRSPALPFETYKLAFTPGLVARVFAGRTSDAMFEDEGRYVHTEGDANWWMPSGRIFYSPDPAAAPPQELAYARRHFFLPHRYRDPFHTDAVSTENFVTYDTYDLLVQESRDALGNRITVGERLLSGDLDPAKSGNDYRVLQPWRVTDPNRNRTQVAFDALGMVVGTAVMGKPEEVLGDALDRFSPDLSEAVVLDHLAQPLTDPHAILGRATTRLVYDLFAYRRTKQQPDPQPAVVYSLARETHDADLAPDELTKVRHSFSYSDGFGREIQKKIQAEPGPLEEGGPDVSLRWVGSGWTIFNNKGKPVRQYEPFFDDTHGFRFGKEVGVSPVLFYDPVERVVATLHPNHTWEKVVFDPWRQETWDVNDTIHTAYRYDPRADELPDEDFRPTDDPDAGHYFERLDESETWPTWSKQRLNATLAVDAWPDPDSRRAEQRAARLAARHAGTPSFAHFDSLGRPFLTVTDNGRDPEGDEQRIATRVELDVEGNQRQVIDARGLPVMEYEYDMPGNGLVQRSMDAGERLTLANVAGNAIRAWGSRQHRFRTTYDVLQRPTHLWVRTGNEPEVLAERTVYGESRSPAEAMAVNLLGRVWLQLDGAGLVESGGTHPDTLEDEAFDYKGNLLRGSRRLATAYKERTDWSSLEATFGAGPLVTSEVTAALSASPHLESETFTSSSCYDALNRVVRQITSDGSVTRPGYNEANLLERIDVRLRGGAEWTAFVTDVDYDAGGRRQRIVYGSGATTDARGVSTRYTYDPLTFRLARLVTVRPSDHASLQDLSYTYDPAGNITSIRDRAQQTIFFQNQVVEPHREYTYDAIYRLIEASGREHLGQVGDAPVPTSPTDLPRVGLQHPGDGNAMGRYRERYQYDAAGNIRAVRHHGTSPSQPGWKRNYQYADDSNRLLSTGASAVRHDPDRPHCGCAPLYEDPYTYDSHGNMTSMPHLPLVQWDFEDQLQATARQVVNDGTPETTWYVYDAGGQRVRKVTERQASGGQVPTRKDERVYLGDFEVYRAYEADSNTVQLERETFHVMDGMRRIAVLETCTQDHDSPERLIRYQFGDHLGSAFLELDHEGRIISYEEYYPFGSTSYQVVRSRLEVSRKRYQYTDKERDEESGLYYHGARYYACWIGRWISADPAGIVDETCLYCYVRNNPVRAFDPDGRDLFDVVDSIFNPSNPIAKGVLDNLERRGEQIINAPSQIVKMVEEKGAVGLAMAAGDVAHHLVKDTGEAVGDIVYEVEHYQGDKSAEKIASRVTDVVLNTADAVTLVAGGYTAAKGGTGAMGSVAVAQTAGARSLKLVVNAKALSNAGILAAQGTALGAIAMMAGMPPEGEGSSAASSGSSSNSTSKKNPTKKSASKSADPQSGAGSGAPEGLPKWREGQPTRGILVTEKGARIELWSGETGGPARFPMTGRNNTITKHVEAHAAQSMRVEGLREATLYINRVPCGVRPGCANNLRRMLPEGARLRVVGPGGYSEPFVGLPDSPRYPR